MLRELRVLACELGGSRGQQLHLANEAGAVREQHLQLLPLALARIVCFKVFFAVRPHVRTLPRRAVRARRESS